MSVKLLSVIILYHPNLVSVKNLVAALHQQNSDLIVVDNSPQSHDSTLSTILNKQDQYLHFPANIGLGAGHNIAIKRAIRENYDFALIFDQDSTITERFIPNLINTFNEVSQYTKAAAVGPSYTDQRFNNTRREHSHVVKIHAQKRMIISSGALFYVAALKDVGLMDESLFIDFIDTEWCYRAQQKGYKVYQSATAIMEHHLGEMQPIFFGLYKMRYMKPLRYYYFTRNLRRLAQEGRIAPATIYSAYLRHLPAMLIKALFLKNTKAYFKNFIKGFKRHNCNFNTLKHKLFILRHRHKKPPLYPLVKKNNSAAILLVSHELSNTGAPRALALLAKALKEDQYHLVLCSPTDGPTRIYFEAMHIPVIIDATLFLDNHNEALVNFAKNFDLVIMNTILSAPAVKVLEGKVKTLWWLHESSTIDEFFNNTRLAVYKATLSHAKNLYTVSEYSKSFINPYQPNAKIIELGIPDQGQNLERKSKTQNDKIVFTMIGAINHKKGVDILIETIKQLPQNYQEQALFNLIGGITEQKFFKPIKKTINQLNCIRYLGAMTEAQVFKNLEETDVLICISRDDSFPMVTLEAWMLGIPCILSKNVGTSKYIQEGKNGFIIDNQKPDQLLQLLCKIIDHRERLDNMQHHARETFISKFSFEKFAERWQQALKENLAN